MNMRRSMIGAAAMLAMAGSGMMVASPSVEPDAGPGEATIRTRRKPSGSTPVPGGGAKERAKRIARMEKAAVKAKSSSAETV